MAPGCRTFAVQLTHLGPCDRVASMRLGLMPCTARTGLPRIHRLCVLLQYKLTQVHQNVSHQHAAVGRWGYQDEVSEHLGYLGRYLCKIGLFALEVSLQQVVDFAVNTVRHFNSFHLTQQYRMSCTTS